MSLIKLGSTNKPTSSLHIGLYFVDMGLSKLKSITRYRERPKPNFQGRLSSPFPPYILAADASLLGLPTSLLPWVSDVFRFKDSIFFVSIAFLLAYLCCMLKKTIALINLFFDWIWASKSESWKLDFLMWMDCFLV